MTQHDAESPRPAPGKIRSTVFSIVVTVAVLFALNAGVEWLEGRGVVDTSKPEDRIFFQDEPIYAVQGEDWVTTEYGLQHLVRSRFPVQKKEGWRLFVLGASFAQGTPYDCCDHDGSNTFGGMASWLRVQLAHRYPNQRIDVVNSAAGGVSSHRVVKITEVVSQLDPDAILVASCNNEGNLSPNTVSEQLHKLGGFRLLSRLLRPSPEQQDQTYFVPQHPDAEVIRKEFKNNLEAMVRITRERGVALLLATLPVNLRSRGFEPGPVIDDDRYTSITGNCASAVEFFHAGNLEAGLSHLTACDSLPDIQPWIGLAQMRLGRFEEGHAALAQEWGACLADGVKAYFQGRYQESVDTLEACENAAEALRWLGLARFEQGDAEGARAALEQATELMPRNRCRPSYNALIREIAASEDHVHLVDFQEAARNGSPRGVPGPELFVDYCHMNWRGYGLMAERAIRTLESTELGPKGQAVDGFLDLEAVARERGLRQLGP